MSNSNDKQEELENLVYIPGVWRCPKCQFTLIQSNLKSTTGQVTSRDVPGEKCPNDGGGLWRVTYKDGYAEIMERAEECVMEKVSMSERLTAAEALLNAPELHDFARGVVLEAAHQRQRWGSGHDVGKTPFDWFWLVGYLAQKAASSAVAGDTEKALHHTISTAAALANWHAALNGDSSTMRPGIDPGRADV